MEQEKGKEGIVSRSKGHVNSCLSHEKSKLVIQSNKKKKKTNKRNEAKSEDRENSNEIMNTHPTPDRTPSVTMGIQHAREI